MMFFKANIFVFYLCYFVIQVNGAPTTTIKQGTLIGKYMASREGKHFSAYLSIPYAEPPIGDLRFKAPAPAKAWNGNLDATAPHEVCPQINIFFQKSEVEGNENCLFLNLYTPKINSSDNNLYSVMVFIHGGGYFSGTGQMYNPDYLLDEDVILVTFNYRLGSLGFLSTGDDVVPGNNGLKDQALAIKWVFENVKAFGGDPEKITIFGESAGGASAHLHMFSPLSQGYVKRVISQSGTAFNQWSVRERDFVLSYSKRTAEYFGCPTEDHENLITCLRSVDANELIKSERSFVEWDIEPICIFTPVVEKNTKNAFLPKHPLHVLKSGKYSSLPWMTGVNSEEGLLRVAAIFKNPKLVEDLDSDLGRILSKLLSAKNPEFYNIAKKIKKFYFGNSKIHNDTMYNTVNLYSDFIFTSAISTAVNLHFKYSKEPVFYYFFSHNGRNSFSEVVGVPGSRYGTCHADELLLQFPLSFMFGNPTLDILDTYYSKLINKLWANFAKTGNPTPDRNSVISTLWKPVSTENLEYYHIGGGVHTSSNLFPERMTFWKELSVSQTLNIRDEL